ncbi:Nucleic acid dioxygenase alkbh1 [Blomia tropicalis]|nr:Nucleic acid dioxygenase alkbh1 [Blomia tropicalis]
MNYASIRDSMIIINDQLEDDNDIYKSTFKYYKQGNDLSKCLDFSKPESFHEKTKRFPIPNISNINLPNCLILDHFKPLHEWEMYTPTESIPGLIIVPGILHQDYRQEWFEYFHNHLPWRDELQLKANVDLNRRNQNQLRWITFGFHHNWDSKIYSLNQPTCIIPKRIDEFSNVISRYLNLDFQPQAGIVNYYNRKSSLCFHTDHSELNHSIPLLSFSLGSPAIFLIGGKTKDSSIPIVPIVLRDSDLLIMSGDSRLALHAIAKIIPEDDKLNSKSICRINLNIRQVQ